MSGDLNLFKAEIFKKVILNQPFLRRVIEKISPECVYWDSVAGSVELVDLEKTHEGYIMSNETIEEIIGSKAIESECRGGLLKDSLYVEFLKPFKDRNPADVSDEELRQTGYYQDGKESLASWGHFRGNTTEADVLAQSRYFLNLYDAIKNKTFFRDYKKFIDAGINHSPEAHARVIRFLDSDYYLVYDGTHRLAAYYVAGHRFVKADVTTRPIGMKLLE